MRDDAKIVENVSFVPHATMSCGTIPCGFGRDASRAVDKAGKGSEYDYDTRRYAGVEA